MILAVGWIRFLAIDDGLRAFSGNELIYAQELLEESPDKMLCRTRIVWSDNGSLSAEWYTWWGITPIGSSCDEFYQVWWSNWDS